ncbi:hypothetical protein SAMD00019534_114460, partial [Acytostelium subglobosum LB1]|uniref:hypothetical protein n=1 Tax=Acytostelium subglobosum LB1 TaxID=1410327 RepID=UPI00064488CC
MVTPRNAPSNRMEMNSNYYTLDDLWSILTELFTLEPRTNIDSLIMRTQTTSRLNGYPLQTMMIYKRPIFLYMMRNQPPGHSDWLYRRRQVRTTSSFITNIHTSRSECTTRCSINQSINQLNIQIHLLSNDSGVELIQLCNDMFDRRIFVETNKQQLQQSIV